MGANIPGRLKGIFYSQHSPGLRQRCDVRGAVLMLPSEFDEGGEFNK